MTKDKKGDKATREGQRNKYLQAILPKPGVRHLVGRKKVDVREIKAVSNGKEKSCAVVESGVKSMLTG